MERIYLTKSGKNVLRALTMKRSCLITMTKSGYCSAIRSLDRHGLVRAMYEEGGGVVDVSLTDEGVAYLSENPLLINPINWGKVSAICSVIAILMAIISLFVACSR